MFIDFQKITSLRARMCRLGRAHRRFTSRYCIGDKGCTPDQCYFAISRVRALSLKYTYNTCGARESRGETQNSRALDRDG